MTPVGSLSGVGAVAAPRGRSLRVRRRRCHRAASHSPCGASAPRRVFAVPCCHGVRARARSSSALPTRGLVSRRRLHLSFPPSASLCRSGRCFPQARGPPASRPPSGGLRAAGRSRGSPAPPLHFATLQPWLGPPGGSLPLLITVTRTSRRSVAHRPRSGIHSLCRPMCRPIAPRPRRFAPTREASRPCR